ncbi:proteinase inhibitor PSI-1.2 [Euphorbia lathyris]|uniref:proteinase inhibitor PSI-1.2 n=1 Tax=Euphorbia lathyris TaxID=212925 RepID=UPI003313C522
MMRARACPLYCLQVDYMTCESTGSNKLTPSCINCCLAPKDCTLHLVDGSSIHCMPH